MICGIFPNHFGINLVFSIYYYMHIVINPLMILNYNILVYNIHLMGSSESQPVTLFNTFDWDSNEYFQSCSEVNCGKT